jgi:hypothetical protein
MSRGGLFYIIDITLPDKKYFKKIFGEIKNITYICNAQGARKPRLLADG